MKKPGYFFSNWLTVQKTTTQNHFGVLDGWRGLSILLVLATHLLPLGPKPWRFNEATGLMGMAIFFTLSGFLITNFLIHRPNVYAFLIRRFFRILPLAWLYLAIALPYLSANLDLYPANFFFYANFPPMQLTAATSHYWSLCVEMQFYVGIALLFLFFRERALFLTILICLFVTGYRIYHEKYVAINTYYRIDEILVGVIIAMAYHNKLGNWLPRFFKKINPYFVMPLLIISCHPESGFMNYLRPYLAATLVASTLYSPPPRLSSFLNLKILVYIASISYALYIIHPLLTHTWLGDGEGDKIIKYAKRPLLFVVLFILAHISTFYYEKHWITLAKKITS